VSRSARHVLVTGAAGGIGRAVAERFAADGDNVSGADVREAELVEAMRELSHRYGVATAAFTVDLANPGCDSVVAEAAEQAGEVDVLVNAAGIYPATALEEMTAPLWDRVQHVNVRAPVLLTVALAARAAAASRPASVVNISSGAATRARPGAAHYCTSKAALEMATKACAVELAGHAVRVNAVAPGFVAVDSPVNPVTADYAAAVSVNPLGRAGGPDEVAAAVSWLAGDEATFVTGAVLRVDGGATAGTSVLPQHYPTVTDLQSVGTGREEHA
jgi:NAD(P)-dependent dehydrogenase (short-subunit alcohol dehydrogenase family)